jgi:competence protein ComEA
LVAGRGVLPRFASNQGGAIMKDNAIRTLVQGLIVSLLPMGAALAGPVNLNSADAATLAKELDGIGPAKAQAIIEFRQKNGPFKSPEDLLKVDGIGERVLEQNRGNIRLSGAAAAPAPAGKAAAKPGSKPAAAPAGH